MISSLNYNLELDHTNRAFFSKEKCDDSGPLSCITTVTMFLEIFI